jgi:hypothetical protein
MRLIAASQFVGWPNRDDHATADRYGTIVNNCPSGIHRDNRAMDEQQIDWFGHEALPRSS